MKTYDFNNGMQSAYNIQKSLKDNNINYDVKITSLKHGDFNSYEGEQFYFNIKITILDNKVFASNNGKSKIFSIHTNSTYLDDFEHKDLKAELTEYIENLYI